MESFKFLKIRNVPSPSRGTPFSAGIDFYVPYGLTANEMAAKQPVKGQIQILANEVTGEIKKYIIHPGKRILIPSGIKAKMPKGYCGIFFNKSGVASRAGVIVGSCVVDSDYQGEIHLSIMNVSDEPLNLLPGTKLTQMLIIPESICDVEEVNSLEDLYDEETVRGEGGFGSTGTSAETQTETPVETEEPVELQTETISETISAKKPAKTKAIKKSSLKKSTKSASKKKSKVSKKTEPNNDEPDVLSVDKCREIEALVDQADPNVSPEELLKNSME